MCLAIYISSDRPLPHIKWDDENPSFHVIDLSENEKGIQKHLSFEYVCYIGSYEGCSCAFNIGREYPDFEYETDEIQLADKSRKELVEYLNKLSINRRIQIYSCAEGESDKLPKYFRSLTAEEILKSDFVFQESEVITISKGA